MVTTYLTKQKKVAQRFYEKKSSNEERVATIEHQMLRQKRILLFFLHIDLNKVLPRCFLNIDLDKILPRCLLTLISTKYYLDVF